MKRKIILTAVIAVTLTAVFLLYYFPKDSVARLPTHIAAPNGQLSLFADYSDVDLKQNRITLYLVNKTEKDFTFAAQDGDLFIKQEVQIGGEWTRAQIHRFGWCGNSYQNPPTLKSGKFLKYAGNYPSAGEDYSVRYKMYDSGAIEGSTVPIDLVSNIGRGKADPKQIKAASSDTLAIYNGSFEFLSKIVRREVVAEPQDHVEPRSAALSALRRHNGPKTLALLKDVLAEEKLDQHEFYSAYFTFIDLDKAEAVEWSLKVLNDKKHPLRLNVAQQAWRTENEQIQKCFGRIIDDYSDPAFIAALANYSSQNTIEARDRLQRIRDDPLLPMQHRDAVKSICEQQKVSAIAGQK